MREKEKETEKADTKDRQTDTHIDRLSICVRMCDGNNSNKQLPVQLRYGGEPCVVVTSPSGESICERSGDVRSGRGRRSRSRREEVRVIKRGSGSGEGWKRERKIERD